MPNLVNPSSLVEIATKTQKNEDYIVEYSNIICDRIESINPDIQALLSESGRRERLLDDAIKLETQYTSEMDQPELYGIPIGVKDNIHVDGFSTPAGMGIPPEIVDTSEATCVTRLLNAGALVVGKTVSTQFAGGAPWRTRNPHNLNCSPGGSSSGSAAGVAAGLFPLALGIQTGGSVIKPAAFCGVVGMKPSNGRIPLDGIVTQSKTLDQVGMFTQDVDGMKTVAAVLCDDWQENVSVTRARPRIGVPEGRFNDCVSESAQSAFETQLSSLAAAGCDIQHIPIPTINEIEEIEEFHRVIKRAELALNHHDRFTRYEGFYSTAMAKRIREGQEITSVRVQKAQQRRSEVRSKVEEITENNELDIWATPATSGPAPADIRKTGDSVMNKPWTFAGVPSVTLPTDVLNGLPIGIQLVSVAMDDEQLLHWAKIIEDII